VAAVLALGTALAPVAAPAAAPTTAEVAHLAPTGQVSPAQVSTAPTAAASVPVAQRATAPSPGTPDGSPARGRTTRGKATVSRAAARVDPDDSFLVRIDRVRPGVLPTKGSIRLSGTVRNISGEARTGLNVHPLSSSYPITTAEELAAAADAAPEMTFGGERLQEPALLDNSIEELQPDETARWSITVPVDELVISGGDGVYVLGVQVLADDADGGRDGIADGRARTFVPRVTARDARATASLVVPVRQSVRHTSSGEVADADDWERRLDGGRLDNVVRLLEEAADVPVSVALDPALLDVAAQLAQGNAPRDLEPTVSPDEEPPGGGTATGSGSQTSEASVSSGAVAAELWRERLVTALVDHDVLALPYGDLEVIGASHWAPAQMMAARELATQVLETDGVASRPAVIPPRGLLPTDTMRSLPEETTVVLGARAGGNGADGAEAVRVGSHVAVLSTDVTGAADPQDPESATGLRQRILAETAVRALAGDDRPLVVNLPTDFDPGRRTESLLDELDADFIRWRPLNPAAATATEVERLAYPEDDDDLELPAPHFRAAQDAMVRGNALDDVLPLNDAIASTVQREALTDVSHHTLDEGPIPLTRLVGLRQWVDDQLGKVTLSAPSFVILSSESGPFSMTVRNDLDQPVTFAISARTNGDVEIRAPGALELEAGASQTVNLEATSRAVGVHEVDLQLVTSAGQPLNPGEQLNIRSNSVGKIIWVVLATGLGILAIAVPLRIYRRVRKVRGAGA